MTILRMDTDQVAGLIADLSKATEAIQGELKSGEQRIANMDGIWQSRSMDEYRQLVSSITSRLTRLAREGTTLRLRLAREKAEWEEAARQLGGLGGTQRSATGGTPTASVEAFLAGLVGEDLPKTEETFFFEYEGELGIPLQELSIPGSLELSGDITYKITRQLDGTYKILVQGEVGKGISAGVAGFELGDHGALEFVVDPKDNDSLKLLQSLFSGTQDSAGQAKAVAALAYKGIHSVEISQSLDAEAGVDVSALKGFLEGGLSLKGGVEQATKLVNGDGQLTLDKATAFELTSQGKAATAWLVNASGEGSLKAVVITHQDFKDVTDLLKSPTRTTVELETSFKAGTESGFIVTSGVEQRGAYKVSYEFDNTKIPVSDIYLHIADRGWIESHAVSTNASFVAGQGDTASAGIKVDGLGGVEVSGATGREKETFL